MPRVNRVKKNAGGKAITCNKCGKPIEPGQEYLNWAFRYGGKHVRHAACGYPRQSELTQSKMSGVYAAQESIEDAVSDARKNDDISGLADAVRDAISEIEGVKDEYQDAIDAMPQQLQDGSPIAEDMRDKIDNLDSYITDLEAAASQVEGYVDDAEAEEPEEPEVEDEHEQTCSKRAALEPVDLAFEGSVVTRTDTECTCKVKESKLAHERWEEDHKEWETKVSEAVDAACTEVEGVDFGG